MFLFEGEFGRVLHSGDIRATPEMASTVKEINEVDIAFVDATYCHPDFDFPTQEDAMFECTRLALQARVDDANTDIYVGVDSLGKEELLIAISKALRQPANVRKDRYDIIAAHDDSNLHHFQLQAKEEQSTVSRQQGSLVADSWWLLSPSRTRKQSGPGRNILILQATCSGREKRHESVPGVTVRRVQYSSHSSFSELQSFVHALGAERVFATPESVYDDGKIREPSLWFGNPRMTIKKRVRANGPCIERVGWALDKLRQPANGAVFQDCNNVIVISDDEDEPSVRAGEKSQFQSCDGVVASSDGERDGCGDIAATVGRKWSGSVICEELYSIPLVNKYGEAIPQPP